MIELKLGERTVARSLRPSDVGTVYDLMTQSREHLDRWLCWSASLQSLEDVRAFIARFEAKESRGDGFHLGIWEDEQLTGGAVCWYIDRANRNAEAGYWLGSAFTGRGLATRGARAVSGYLMDVEGLHRIEMQCGVENAASRAVAERCGLSNEGIRRASHWITDRFVDHVVYGILAPEWQALRASASPCG